MWDRASLTSLVSVGLAVLAYLWYQSPLQSSRPFPADESNLRSNFVDARPWEDPLEAVESHDKSETGEHRAPHHPFGLKRPREDAVAFLFALTNGRPYPEGHETRLDDRYAVGSALAVACYIASGDDPLDYFTWPNSREKKDLLTSKQSLKVPFEWYTRRADLECAGDTPFEHVLVIWLNNQEFGSHPLKAISSLSQDLCEGPIRQVASCRTMAFKIIGPGDSDTYERMVDEVASTERFSWAGQRVDLYSPRATRSDRFLSQSILTRLHAEPTKELEEGLSSAFRDHAINLEYHIAQDLEVFTTLIEELGRRNIDPAVDSIALVSELDTKYGRALPREFAVAACASKSGLAREDSKPEGRKNKPCPALLRELHQGQELDRDGHVRSLQALEIIRANPQSMPNLTVYSYVRGLDGLTINKLGQKAKSGGQGSAPSKNKERERFPWDSSTEYLERPAEEGQYDYVRRLVQRIKQGENGSPRPVKAIGVLGTDIFDKLLILEALRQDFPGTIFFTTDLEAWLFHESQHEWTRNLVVASAFGLKLDAGLQKNVPPFRSSYQTSTFFATLRALDRLVKTACSGAADGSSPQRECYRLIGSDKIYASGILPRLFEIGRNGPVDISVESVESAGLETVHPARPGLIPRFVLPSLPPLLTPLFFRYLLLFMLFGAICFMFIVPSILQGTRRGRAYVLGLAVFAALVVLAVYFWGTDERYVEFLTMTLISSAFAIGLLIVTLPQMFRGAFRHPALLPSFVISGTAVWLGVLALVRCDAQGGEPFSLWDGVSTWPTIVIRLIAIVLVVYFLRSAYVAIRDSDDMLVPRHIRQSWPGAGFLDRAAWIFRDPPQVDRATTADEVQMVQKEYLRAGELRHRVGRMVIMLIMFGGFVGLLFLVDGMPPRPCRGAGNCGFDGVTLVLSVLSLLLLNLYVFDATQLCRAFIDNLIGPPKPGVTAERYRDVIGLIEDRTATIGPLVYYPFITLALMIVSRYRFFDNWTFPWPLIVAWFLNAAFVFWSAYMLKQAAERARARAVQYLNELLVSPAATPTQIPVLLDAIKTTRKGSFDHIMQQPAVSSSLIAILAALQYYFTK